MTLPTRLIGGRYRVIRKIAEGGMGEVFQAEHNLSKKAVALKVLFAHIGKDQAARDRFMREVSAPAQIGHIGIVEVYDAGFDSEDGSLFVAMELLDGEPLRDRLARGGVPINQLLDWFEELLDPLAAAHEKGIVHRDLKPENIMFTTDRGKEVLKILDFGIARDLDSSSTNVTQTGIAMGTPHYMAPEQAMSAKGVTAAADVWALGVMLYEALLGRPPFDGETASAIVVHACTQPHSSLTALAPHVPTPLARFVDRCLAKEPQGRPQNARQMLEELKQLRTQVGSDVTAQPIPQTAHATGPMAGAPASGLMAGQPTPQPVSGIAGTAMLPQATPPPGGFGTGPQAFGTGPQQPGFQTPAPHGGAPGYHTPPPGSFGATSAPGSFGVGGPTPPPTGGFGTAPAGQFGTPAPGGFGAPAYAQPKKSGAVLPIVIGVLALGLLVVTGGIAVAVFALSGDDDEDATPAGSIGTLRITTDVPAGELFVDGSTRGPMVAGQTFRLAQGHHRCEIRENGLSVANAEVDIVANQESSVVMNRTSAAPVPTPNGPTAVPMIPGNVQTFTGQLRQEDTTLNDSGKYYDTFEFQWTSGTLVRLELDSPHVDTYLILRSPSGVQQENDDREPGNFNAALQTTLNETGTWRVLCTSFSAGETGDYTLTVRGP